jgi:hypothetical protein
MDSVGRLTLVKRYTPEEVEGMVHRTSEPVVAMHRSEVKVMEQSSEVARAWTERRLTGQFGTSTTL